MVFTIGLKSIVLACTGTVSRASPARQRFS